jgi:hypothetical protein
MDSGKMQIIPVIIPYLGLQRDISNLRRFENNSFIEDPSVNSKRALKGGLSDIYVCI